MKIIYNGITLEVEGDYEPAEEMVSYDSNMEGYPGCAASFSIYTVLVGGEDITDIVSVEHLKKIEELTLQKILD